MEFVELWNTMNESRYKKGSPRVSHCAGTFYTPALLVRQIELERQLLNVAKDRWSDYWRQGFDIEDALMGNEWSFNVVERQIK